MSDFPSNRGTLTVSESSIQSAIFLLAGALRSRIEFHSNVAFASPEEVLGVLTEEMKELQEDIQGHCDLMPELLNVAVPAIFAVAGIIEGRNR